MEAKPLRINRAQLHLRRFARPFRFQNLRNSRIINLQIVAVRLTYHRFRMAKKLKFQTGSTRRSRSTASTSRGSIKLKWRAIRPWSTRFNKCHPILKWKRQAVCYRTPRATRCFNQDLSPTSRALVVQTQPNRNCTKKSHPLKWGRLKSCPRQKLLRQCRVLC